MERDEPSPEGIARLRKLLGHRSNHVVGRAARLAGAWGAAEAIPELVGAFDRFLQLPVKTDPGCEAKQPVIEALFALGHSDPEIYLSGVRYRQPEPSFGPPIDTAAGVRGASGHALLYTGYPDAWFALVALLNDPEPRTRRMAMESLGGSGSYHAELLLRMAVLAGDAEPDITALGLQALMLVEPERSLAFVRRYLDDRDPVVAEGAALAIGEARLPESFPVLRKAWNSQRWSADRAALALPIALTREDEACAFLMDVIRDERERLANAALKALSIYASQPDRVAEIRAAVDARGSRELAQTFNQVFET